MPIKGKASKLAKRVSDVVSSNTIITMQNELNNLSMHKKQFVITISFLLVAITLYYRYEMYVLDQDYLKTIMILNKEE